MSTDCVKIRFERINEGATAPVFGSAYAAGADLSSAESLKVPARGKCLVSTGLRVAIPAGHYGRIAPRSGLALKHFIDVGAGVVDEDYRGELRVLLFNHSESDFIINRGDRVAQLICERISRPILEEVPIWRTRIVAVMDLDPPADSDPNKKKRLFFFLYIFYFSINS